MALGLGLLCWIALIFSPAAFVQTVSADDVDNYGTVIGIVRARAMRFGLLSELPSGVDPANH